LIFTVFDLSGIENNEDEKIERKKNFNHSPENIFSKRTLKIMSDFYPFKQNSYLSKNIFFIK